MRAENVIDGYDRALGIMTEATNAARRDGISLAEFFTALVDFTSAAALMLGGEKCLQAFIGRMQSRIDDFRAGTFPGDDPAANPCARDLPAGLWPAWFIDGRRNRPRK